MLDVLVALIALTGHAPHACPSCSDVRAHAAVARDWRDDLPPEIREVVARVDRQDEAKQPQTEEEKRIARHQADIQADIEMGKKYSTEIEKDPKIKMSANAEIVARVERIGAELAEIANSTPVEVSWGDSRLNPFPYVFKVIQGDDVNAFSIPGGFIYVYEGLVKYAESDDELAGVIGHEIAHASFRHIATLRREASKLDVVQIPLILLAVFTGGATAQGALLAGSLIGTALTSGWSVKAEQSADFGGFQYIRQSKYNPVGVLTFMERLAYDERNKPQFEWGIFRTHPPSRERARAIMKRLADARVPIKRSQVTQTLKTQIKPGDDGTVDIWYANIKLYSFAGTDALTRADAAAMTLDTLYDAVPRIFEINAEGLNLVGRGRVLFAVTDDDARAAKKKPDELAEDASKALKRAAYDLSYRIWDAQF